MKNIIRAALKEALFETVSELIIDIESGKLDIQEVECACGEPYHEAGANYCYNCGLKLENSKGNDPLSLGERGETGIGTQ